LVANGGRKPAKTSFSVKTAAEVSKTAAIVSTTITIVFKSVTVVSTTATFVSTTVTFVAELTIKDWLTIKTSVAEAAADAKSIAAIKEQVENQRATIDIVATEAQKAENLSEEASNKVALAEQKLASLNLVLAETSVALTNLNNATEFILLVTKAEAGDRAAYFKLNSQQSGLKIEKAIVLQILEAISAKVEAETLSKEVTTQPLWDIYGIDPKEATLAEFQKYYSNSANPNGRFSAVRQVFNDNRFSERDRFDFVATVLQNDSDLGILQEACNLVDSKRKSNAGFNHWDTYLLWYYENRADFKTNSGALTQ